MVNYTNLRPMISLGLNWTNLAQDHVVTGVELNILTEQYTSLRFLSLDVIWRYIILQGILFQE